MELYTATGKLSLKYMDKIISDWHDAGAKTLEECEVRLREGKAELVSKEESDGGRNRSRKKTVKSAQRHGDFDPEEALRRALERSFFDDITPESAERD